MKIQIRKPDLVAKDMVVDYDNLLSLMIYSDGQTEGEKSGAVSRNFYLDKLHPLEELEELISEAKKRLTI